MKNLFLSFTIGVAFFYASQSTAIHHQKKRTANIKDSTIIQDTVFKTNKKNLGFYSHMNDKRFINRAVFDSVLFPYATVFTSSIFDNDASFSDAKFSSFADFNAVTFRRDANFTSARFHRFLFMSGLATDTMTIFYFYNANLPALIDFSHNTFMHRVTNFTNANFDLPIIKKTFRTDTRHFINLFNSDIQAVKMDYEHFRMCFYDPQKIDNKLGDLITNIFKKGKKSKQPDTEFTQFAASPEFKEYTAAVFPDISCHDTLIQRFARFYFDKRQFPARLDGDQIDALYSRLLHNFEERGQEDSYEILNVDYQDYKWEYKWPWVSWFHIFPKYWNWYGTERVWILGWTPGLLLLLTMITFLSYKKVFRKDRENKVIYHMANIPDIDPDNKASRWIRFRNSFIFTCVIFFSFSLKTEKLDFKRPAFFYVIFINAMGLLCLAYLANFILQK